MRPSAMQPLRDAKDPWLMYGGRPESPLVGLSPNCGIQEVPQTW
jgi:hypothetical protein